MKTIRVERDLAGPYWAALVVLAFRSEQKDSGVVVRQTSIDIPESVYEVFVSEAISMENEMAEEVGHGNWLDSEEYAKGWNYMASWGKRKNPKNAGSEKLYHTTSFHAADRIRESNCLQPGPQGFVSFSEIPITHGDISANQVVLAFRKDMLLGQVEKVRYTESWYESHTEQAAYIAGEGWREQLDLSECFDEDDEWGESDSGCEEELTRFAEIESFMYKSNEKEWVSVEQYKPVCFGEDALVDIISVAEMRQ